MVGITLVVYCVAMLVSLVSAMAAVYFMMEVLKIDASTSAVGKEGMTRGDNLRWLVLCGSLAPMGATFAAGFTFSVGVSLFTALAALFALLLACSIVYMATSVAEAPQRSTNVTSLKQAS